MRHASISALEIVALRFVDLRGACPQARCGELAVRRGCRSVFDGPRGFVPRFELAGEREQLRQRGIVGDVDAPGACQCGEREIDRPAPLLVDLGDLVECDDLLDRIVDVLELGVEDHDELLPPVLCAIHRFEQLDHARAMLVVDHEALERVDAALPQLVAVQDFLELIDRGRQIVQLRLVDIGQTQPELRHLDGIVGATEACLEQIDEIVPLRACAEQPLELGDGLAIRVLGGRRIAAVGREHHLAPAFDRARGVVQAVLDQARTLGERFDP